MIEALLFDINQDTIVNTYEKSFKFHQAVVRSKNHYVIKEINSRVINLQNIFNIISDNFIELQQETFTKKDISMLVEMDDIADNALNIFEKILGSSTVDNEIKNSLEKETIMLYSVSYMIKVIKDQRNLSSIIGLLPTIKIQDMEIAGKEIRAKRKMFI